MKRIKTALAILMFFASSVAGAEQTLRAPRVGQVPEIDGIGNDKAWSLAKPITVKDGVSDTPITLRAVHDGKDIFILAGYPDANESRQHKPLIWNKSLGMYEPGPQREDTLILKWNLSDHPVDLSLGSDSEYHADIWYWKADRTDPKGYADDKIQVYSANRSGDATPLVSRSGKLFYLSRKGDQGEPVYEAVLEADYKGDRIPGFTHHEPKGSRADVRAKGQWRDGYWTIEFRRKLDTGHADDVVLVPGRPVVFGVSRYEIAGRPVNPKQDQPLHGAGDIGEPVRLILE